MKNSILTLLLILLMICSLKAQRKEISLNGTWEITRTDKLSGIPSTFDSKIPVPGLIDMAIPALPETGDRKDSINQFGRGESHLYNNSVYWYKRSFKVEDTGKEIIQLKINKSMYNTKIYLNGKLAGSNIYCFTPTYINLKPFLRSSRQENELIISVGSRNNMPDSVVRSDDFEKDFFAPGIYDDVKLILSGYPSISNIQAVPDIEKGQLRVVAEFQTEKDQSLFDISYTIRETVSRKIIAEGRVKGNSPVQGQGIIDFTAKMPGYKLWSPETPFLYDLEIKTKGDSKVQRFGMRTFSSAKEGGVVELNGKTYFMRGTNVCIFRFFEDADRGSLPWNQQWVTKLHTNFKDMHWNSIRYCIGFPPERWYEIADSVGFLIQDEYPIWKGTKIPKLSISSNGIANEYTSWMRERWNHPCVVIWDGQNESVWDTTAIAINKVRPLDLSNRPWDNGWAMPASPTDMREVHIYLTWKYFVDLNNKKPVVYKDGFLKDLMKEPTKMSGYNYSPELKNPVIFNEYCWMWLNRDGSPTTLSENLYANLFPNLDTPEKRLEFYAKFLGMETEYWRSHRQCAAVMHFCGLGHSRPTIPRGQTSDNFTDIKKLKFDKYFYKYVRPAFNPVGIMLNFWDEKLQSGSKIEVPVNLINDTYEEWNGNIKLSLIKGDISILNQVIASKIMPLGKEIYNSTVVLPKEKGKFKLVAEIIYKGESIKSIREVTFE